MQERSSASSDLIQVTTVATPILWLYAGWYESRRLNDCWLLAPWWLYQWASRSKVLYTVKPDLTMAIVRCKTMPIVRCRQCQLSLRTWHDVHKVLHVVCKLLPPHPVKLLQGSGTFHHTWCQGSCNLHCTITLGGEGSHTGCVTMYSYFSPGQRMY